VLPCIDKETENSFFAKRFGGFQPMQAFNEHEPSAIRPYQYRRSSLFGSPGENSSGST
jgi:hypothetical protein